MDPITVAVTLLLTLSPAGEMPDACCFTNPRYAGVCRETPTAETTCADILAYLNNEAASGKTYCGRTEVRGGWAQVACEDAEPEAVTPGR